jgi:8-oxo-dGTP pyrophosphatase MutT (NUDIX family)
MLKLYGTPGGKREPYDESANHTACREMSEESGGEPAAVLLRVHAGICTGEYSYHVSMQPPRCATKYSHWPAFAAGLLEEQHLMGQPDTVVWYPNGKYVVFPRQVGFAHW